MTTDVRGPDGLPLDPQINGPDGNEIPERLWPFVWSQPSREKGAMRRPEGGLSYETAWAVVDPSGQVIGSVLVPSFDALLEELRLLRKALTYTKIAADLGDLNL